MVCSAAGQFLGLLEFAASMRHIPSSCANSHLLCQAVRVPPFSMVAANGGLPTNQRPLLPFGRSHGAKGNQPPATSRGADTYSSSMKRCMLKMTEFERAEVRCEISDLNLISPISRRSTVR